MDVLHRSTTHIHKDAMERWLASHAGTQILSSYPESSNYVSVTVFGLHWCRKMIGLALLILNSANLLRNLRGPAA